MDDETLRRIQARRAGSMDQRTAQARDSLDALIANYRAMVEQDGEEKAALTMLLALCPGKESAAVAAIALVAIQRLSAVTPTS